MDIHCHRCGGFIGNPDGTTYREPSLASPPAIPHSGLCRCEHSLVYQPTAEAAQALRSASRN
jgi:hypothetical protein